MKKIDLKEKGRLLLFALAISSMPTTQAAVIEHIGDRYIIHVPEMELTGEESLLDILQICPDVLTIDGNNLLSGDPFANQYGKFAIRIDNQEYGLDYATVLHHLKAREIEKIQICNHSEVMKGCGSLKRIIDISLRKNEKETSGRIGAFGDTYGGGRLIASVLHQEEKLRILSHVEGNLLRSSDDQGIYNHNSEEGIKLNVLWKPTSKDELEINAIHTYARNHYTATPADYLRAYRLQADYIHTLSENGSTALLTLASEQIGDNGSGNASGSNVREPYHNKCNYPYTVLEFAFPLFSQDLWLTAGFEGGISIEKNCIAHYTNRSNYEDFYGQLDYNIGKWGFMVGDRYRILNFHINQLKDDAKYKDSTHDHAYTISAYHHFAPGHTLQATFCRKFYNVEFGDFIITDYQENEWTSIYSSDFKHRLAYVAELKHTYSKSNVVVSSTIQNVHQDIEDGHDNTLGIGSTVFWHTGIVRLTAGFNYFWEKQSQEQVVHSNFAIFKLAPQLALADGWRFTSQLIWNTRRHADTLPYAPANLYAELGAYKNFGKHWSLEGRFHDIAGQHTGNRAATFGVTYYW